MKKVKILKILKLLIATCLIAFSSALPQIVGFHPFFVYPYYGILLFVSGCALLFKEDLVSRNNETVEVLCSSKKHRKHKKHFRVKKNIIGKNK
jgi:hypothetical protein